MTTNLSLAPDDLRAHAAMVDEGGKEPPSMMRRARDQATAFVGAQSEAGRQAMQSMTLDPASARRQVVEAVRAHPYLAAGLLFGLIALIANFARR